MLSQARRVPFRVRLFYACAGFAACALLVAVYSQFQPQRLTVSSNADDLLPKPRPTTPRTRWASPTPSSLNDPPSDPVPVAAVSRPAPPAAKYREPETVATVTSQCAPIEGLDEAEDFEELKATALPAISKIRQVKTHVAWRQ